MFREFNNRLSVAKKQYLYPGIIIIVVGILTLITLLEQIGPLGFMIILIGMVFIAIYSSKYSKISKEFKMLYVNALLEEEFTNVQYNLEGRLTKQEFYTYEFGLSGNIYRTNDHIEATYKGVHFSLCDVHLQQRTRTGKTTTTVTRFKGPVLRIKLKKAQPGKLQVLESSRITWFDEYDKVEMESIEFNNTFKVYTTNELLAFYVLTPHFMEKLLKVERENPGKLYFTFINGYLNIGLYNREDYFEIGNSSISDTTLKVFKNQIFKVKEIIEEVVKIEEDN